MIAVTVGQSKRSTTSSAETALSTNYPGSQKHSLDYDYTRMAREDRTRYLTRDDDDDAGIRKKKLINRPSEASTAVETLEPRV